MWKMKIIKKLKIDLALYSIPFQHLMLLYYYNKILANKHFHLTYQGESEEILLTEECDINQLKKLYFQLKNIFEKEL